MKGGIVKVNDYFNQALKEHGLTNGSISFDPPTAGRVFKRYKELMKMDNNKLRDHLISKFADLYLGDMPEVETMPLDELEAMIDQLQQAQEADRLNLETDQGIAELKRIVDQYV